jgi:hypothetical protein
LAFSIAGLLNRYGTKNESNMNPQPDQPAEADPERDALLKEFRAYLHLVITAKQTGQEEQLAALPGPNLISYCRALAGMPDNTLAGELAGPVLALFKQIDEAAMHFYRPLYQKKISDPAMQAEHEKILWQLDFALALILRQLPVMARFRARSTQCSDLLCEVIGGMSRSSEVAQLIRRWQKEFPEDERDTDGSPIDGGFPGQFAWDTYQRVEDLDRLVDEFPDYIRMEAREMHGWPMLAQRHTNNNRRFKELAARLELGVKYPLDASEGARFRPDTPMVRYLDPLIFKLLYVQRMVSYSTHESEEKKRESLRQWWWDGQNERPDDEVVAALRALPHLPPLTKTTAIKWTEKAVVPVILATVARDWKNCDEPVLQKIAKQKGVKSKATFKSRLLSAVSATLERLARPA